jgi:hypothetical protein
MKFQLSENTSIEIVVDDDGSRYLRLVQKPVDYYQPVSMEADLQSGA